MKCETPIKRSTFWAKSSGKGMLALPLLPIHDHLLDVMEVARIILSDGYPLRRTLMHLLGRDIIDAEMSSLLYAVALHDVGKFSLAFQAKLDVLDIPELRQRLFDARCATLGISPFNVPPDKVALIEGSNKIIRKNNQQTLKEHHSLSASFLGDLPGDSDIERIVRNALFPEMTDEGWHGVAFAMAATMAHHGGPIEPNDPTEIFWIPPDDMEQWNPIPALSDCRKILLSELGASEEEIVKGFEFIAQWPPEAFSFLLGLTVAVDWLGSDTRHFPVSRAPEFDRRKAAESAAMSVAVGRGYPDVASPQGAISDLKARVDGKFSDLELRDSQKAVLECDLPDRGDIFLLEEETGQGKTMAAVLFWARLAKERKVSGLTFLVPTKAAAKKLFSEDISAIVSAFCPGTSPVLAVPGYREMLPPGHQVELGELQPPSGVASDPEEWARTMRHRAFAGLVSVGTVDQLMLAALPAKFGHLRSTCVAPNLLVIDEIHASDSYMTVLIEEIVKRHSALGGITLLMSATLGEQARRKFLSMSSKDPITVPYPLLASSSAGGSVYDMPPAHTRAQKEFSVGLIENKSAADWARQQALQGRRVLVIRNTVKDAIKTTSQLEQMQFNGGLPEGCLFHINYNDENVFTPHHSRFSPEDRKLLDEKIGEFLQPGLPPSPKIVVATQTAEQSLDIDADVLITDICPMDCLLQRMGRVWRRVSARKPDGIERPIGMDNPEVFLLDSDISGIGQEGFVANVGPEGAYDTLVTAATLALIKDAASSKQKLVVPRDCRSLVEQVLNPERSIELASKYYNRDRVKVWQLIRLAQENLKEEVGNSVIYRWQHYPTDWSFYHPYNATDPLAKRLATRLGISDITVLIKGDHISALGTPINSLTLPGGGLRNVKPPEKPINLIEMGKGEYAFEVAGLKWSYGRLGLRRVS